MNTQMIRKAVKLFPMSQYTKPSSVRHARINWVKSVNYLRNSESTSWVIDRPILKNAA